MSACAPVERRMSEADLDAAYRWLLAICRSWLAERAGPCPGGDPPPPPCPQTIERMAYVHGVEPILHARIRQSASLASMVPTNLKERWERAYYTTRLKNIEMLQAMSEIFDACAHMGVGLLALKGPAAIAGVYRDVGLRPMADLDVLCRARDLPAAAAIARSLGFTETGTPHLHQLDFYDRRRDVLLEIHFDAYHFVSRKRQYLESAWRDARTASVEEWTFPVMSFEHQTVFDLAHCVQDGFEVALKHVVDFAGKATPGGVAMRRETVEALVEEAAGLGDVFPLFVGTIETLLEMPLRLSPSRAPSPDRLTVFAEGLVARSTSLGFRVPTAGGPFFREPGIARKVAFAWKRLFPPLVALRASRARESGLRAVPDVAVHAATTLADAVIRVLRQRRSGG